VSKLNKLFYKHLLEEAQRQYDYEYVNADYESNCCWLEALCKLGAYTNVGVNRTAGMGVMGYFPKEYLSEMDFLVKD